jgi:hypothetical protein
MPNEPEAGFKLGKALEKQGKLVEARRQYERFLEHSKGGPFEEEARKALIDKSTPLMQRLIMSIMLNNS